MKQLTILFSIIVMLISCNSEKRTHPLEDQDSVVASLTLNPYNLVDTVDGEVIVEEEYRHYHKSNLTPDSLGITSEPVTIDSDKGIVDTSMLKTVIYLRKLKAEDEREKFNPIAEHSEIKKHERKKLKDVTVNDLGVHTHPLSKLDTTELTFNGTSLKVLTLDGNCTWVGTYSIDTVKILYDYVVEQVGEYQIPGQPTKPHYVYYKSQGKGYKVESYWSIPVKYLNELGEVIPDGFVVGFIKYDWK